MGAETRFSRLEDFRQRNVGDISDPGDPGTPGAGLLLLLTGDMRRRTGCGEW